MNPQIKFPVIAVVAILAAAVFTSGCKPPQTTAEITAREAAKIADFNLPEDYRPELAVHVLDYSLVSYNPGDGHSHLYLVQSEKAADREKLEEILAGNTPGKEDWSTRMTVVETRETTLRGEKATLVFSKGVNSQGEIYAQVTGFFQGRGGPALVVLEEPVARWDMDRVETFLGSIR